VNAEWVVLLLRLQEVTWSLKQTYPDRILTAEITPEDPQLMAQYGFDAIWVHSGEPEQPGGTEGTAAGACCLQHPQQLHQHQGVEQCICLQDITRNWRCQEGGIAQVFCLFGANRLQVASCGCQEVLAILPCSTPRCIGVTEVPL
jgi:hypothetical protein